MEGIFVSHLWWNNRNRTYYSALKTKNWTKYTKILSSQTADNNQCRTVIPEKRKTNKSSPSSAPAHWLKKWVPWREIQTDSCLGELRRQSWEDRVQGLDRTRQLIFVKQILREEGATQRYSALEICKGILKSLIKYWSVNVEEKTKKTRKNTIRKKKVEQPPIESLK